MNINNTVINNAFYDELSDGWMSNYDHPIALLRAENKVRNPWIADVIEENFASPVKILDIGCGAGLLTHYLAQKKHEVFGIDLSLPSLEIAKKYDPSKSVKYQVANAYDLPFANESFDVVTAMDVLEHVESPQTLIAEASRILRPRGLFFFHTFNRNLLSYLMVIKGVEWFVPNTPSHMHIYRLFLKPKELKSLCQKNQLSFQKVIGLRPSFSNISFWKMIFCKKVEKNFSFTFSSSLLTGYCGFARKNPSH